MFKVLENLFFIAFLFFISIVFSVCASFYLFPSKSLSEAKIEAEEVFKFSKDFRESFVSYFPEKFSKLFNENDQ